jgi:hypothetical protein
VTHLVILPVLLPLIAGSVLLLAAKLGSGLRRAIGLAATLALLPVALLLLERVRARKEGRRDLGDEATGLALLEELRECGIKLWLEGEKRWVRLRVSNAGLRLIDKRGIEAVLADLRAKGEL